MDNLTLYTTYISSQIYPYQSSIFIKERINVIFLFIQIFIRFEQEIDRQNILTIIIVNRGNSNKIPYKMAR